MGRIAIGAGMVLAMGWMMFIGSSVPSSPVDATGSFRQITIMTYNPDYDFIRSKMTRCSPECRP